MKRIFVTFLSFMLLLASFPTEGLQAKSISNIPTAEFLKPENEDSNTTTVAFPKGPKAKSLSSASAIVMDANTGLILYNKKADDKHYPASITKIMTTLLCIENCNNDEVVTFKESEVLGLESGASNIGTKVGEKLTIEQCLYAIMLASANEVCLGVADYIAGSIPAFADLMNKRASELGCKNTHFSNPNGLHSDDHYTTAYDMALISKEALKNSTFRKVAGTKTAYIPATNKTEERPPIQNHHNMLHYYTYSQYIYDSCIGGKTGYTSMAQSTLVTFAERDGMCLICVVMKGASPKQSLTKNIYTDTATLLDFAFENYQIHNLASGLENTDSVESPLFTRYSTFFDPKTAPLQTSNNGQIILPNGAEVSDTEQLVEFYDSPQEKEQKTSIGSVTYTYNGQLVGQTDIYYSPVENNQQLASLEDMEFTKKISISSSSNYISTILKYVIITLIAVILIIFIFFYIRLLRRRKLLSKRKNQYIGEPKKKDLHF